MRTTTQSRIIRGFLAIASGAIAVLGMSGAVVAANCTITTVPEPPTITVGQSVDFTGSVSGKSPHTYDWTFAGGTPATSSQETVTVTYNSTGSFQATLDGTNSAKKNTTCSASVTVTVNDAGGNQPPTAADDSYNTTEDTPLSVPAPGVLGNDNDPDNDPITVADPRTNAPTSQGGTVTLNTDGSFDYTPAGGFTGDDTFTYQATDGEFTSNTATVTITVNAVGGGGPTARGDAYATPIGKTLNVAADRVSGVL